LQQESHDVIWSGRERQSASADCPSANTDGDAVSKGGPERKDVVALPPHRRNSIHGKRLPWAARGTPSIQIAS
jgi:hypothetical protein